MSELRKMVPIIDLTDDLMNIVAEYLFGDIIIIILEYLFDDIYRNNKYITE
jgi:hypothetical protein